METSSHIRRVFAVSLLAGLAAVSVPAQALSCVGVSDRFFVNCPVGSCQVVFRARDIAAPGACNRRTLVESVPPDVAVILLGRVSTQMASGEYEITLVHRYYGDPPVNGEELARAFGTHELRAPRLTIRQLTPGTNLEALREEWLGRARRSLIELVAYWAVELILLVAGLFGAYRTTVSFRARLLRQRAGSVAVPVAIQLGLFVLAVLSFGSFVAPVLVGLVAPVLLLIWLYELVAYVISRYRIKTANES